MMSCIIIIVICLYLLIQNCVFEISAAVCPTPHQWRQRGQELGCPVSQPYHCLEDEQGEEKEICLSKTWVQPGFCPEFNSIAKKIDVSLCKEANGRCPTVTYWSTDVVKYSACLPVRATTVAVSIAKNTGRYHNATTDQGIASTTTTLTYHDTSSEGSVDILPIILLIILILLVLIAVGIIVMYRKKRNSRKEGSSADEKSAVDLMERENEKNNRKTETDNVDVPSKTLKGSYHDADSTEKDKLLLSDSYFKDDVENGIRKVEQTHILILIGGCKKDLLSTAERIGHHFGTYVVFNDFKSWNDRNLENCIKENKKCVIFNGCFKDKNGGIIVLNEKQDSFKRIYEDRRHLNIIITVPDSVWNARKRVLQKSKLFFDLYVLKITQTKEDRKFLIV